MIVIFFNYTFTYGGFNPTIWVSQPQYLTNFNPKQARIGDDSRDLQNLNIWRIIYSIIPMIIILL